MHNDNYLYDFSFYHFLLHKMDSHQAKEKLRENLKKQKRKNRLNYKNVMIIQLKNI